MAAVELMRFIRMRLPETMTAVNFELSWWDMARGRCIRTGTDSQLGTGKYLSIYSRCPEGDTDQCVIPFTGILFLPSQETSLGPYTVAKTGHAVKGRKMEFMYLLLLSSPVDWWEIKLI